MNKPDYRRICTDNVGEDAYWYKNVDGEIETVTFIDTGFDIVEIEEQGDKVRIFTQDIPKLILALQVAYDFAKREGAV